MTFKWPAFAASPMAEWPKSKSEIMTTIRWAEERGAEEIVTILKNVEKAN